MADVELPGQPRIVDDVAGAFARLVTELTPRSIALSGGEVAHRCYTALRRETLEWSVVEVFFGDERLVPGESDDSNEGKARRILLDHVSPPAVHSVVAAGAAAYDAPMHPSARVGNVHPGPGPAGPTAS